MRAVTKGTVYVFSLYEGGYFFKMEKGEVLPDKLERVEDLTYVAHGQMEEKFRHGGIEYVIEAKDKNGNSVAIMVPSIHFDELDDEYVESGDAITMIRDLNRTEVPTPVFWRAVISKK